MEQLHRALGRPNRVLLVLLGLSLAANWVFLFSARSSLSSGEARNCEFLQRQKQREAPLTAENPTTAGGLLLQGCPFPAFNSGDEDMKQAFRFSHVANRTLDVKSFSTVTVAQNKAFNENMTAFYQAEQQDLQTVMALTEYKHRRFLWHHSHLFCCSEASTLYEKVGWVTATINDAYVIPAVALAHSIRKFSCHADNLLAIVSEEVSEQSREALARAGWQVLERPPLDCQHQGGRPTDPTAKFPGEHMRFHVWNLIDYDRLIYVDCDIMLLDNIDELFHLPLPHGQIYAAHFDPPGSRHNSINSGLLVLRPSSKTSQELIREWQGLFSTAGCLPDQPYLRRFFDRPSQGLRWLPYAYNVRRQAFHPMRLFHMAGGKEYKLWLGENAVRNKGEARDVPIMQVPKDVASVWWFIFYDALDAYGLHDWWQNL
ncbi:exostoses (multiple)-like 2 [Balamuthia mandrillaris]